MTPPPGRAACALAITLLCAPAAAWLGAADYASARAAAVRACDAVDPAAYQTGLVGNPDGYRSFYLRSECFQKAAVQFRDASLCADVRQRRALLSSSWGYSNAQCRKLVAAGLSADRAGLDAMKASYASGAVRLRSFRVERNGNGRDFDIVPAFSGSYAHGYVLRFEILGAAAGPVLLHSGGYYLDAGSNLRLYVRQADIRGRFPGFALDHPYQVRATVVLDVGTGGQAGYWSDAFIESVFPVRERSQSLTLQSVF